MKKLFALLIGLCLAFNCACASAATFGELQNMLRNSDTEETPAEPAGQTGEAQDNGLMTLNARDGLTVVDGNCILMTEDYSSFIDCNVYAVIRNDGDSPVAVDGEIVLTDAQGNTLEDQSFLFPYPDVLAPGETAVITENLMIEKTGSVTKPEQVAGVALTVHADSYTYSTEANVHAQVAAEITQSVDNYCSTVDVVRFTLTNDTGAPLRNPHVVAAVYDAEGRLVLTLKGDTGYDTVILPEGSTLIIECELYSSVTDYLAQTGRTLGTVEAVAYSD